MGLVYDIFYDDDDNMIDDGDICPDNDDRGLLVNCQSMSACLAQREVDQSSSE